VPAEDHPDIDAVITWVDGADPAHRARLEAYLAASGLGGAGAAAPTRFGDCGEIDYCVASLLRHAPWLRRIHIVSDAQTPALLARLQGTADADRVRVVDHRDFFQGYEQYLPTFSNRSIECLMWRLPDLAERFIYLNDDFVLLRPVRATDFFDGAGLVLRGIWRGAAGHRWKARLRGVLAGISDALGRPPGGSKARPGNHAAQALSARLAGFGDRYLQVPHVPHPMRRSALSAFFATRPELLEANVRHRLRADGQFVTTALAAHLELAAGSARVDNRLGAIRLDPSKLSPTLLGSELARLDADPTIAFCCVQSLDLAAPAARRQVLDWLDARIGKPGAA
jgi:hypothetical protein